MRRKSSSHTHIRTHTRAYKHEMCVHNADIMLKHIERTKNTPLKKPRKMRRFSILTLKKEAAQSVS